MMIGANPKVSEDRTATRKLSGKTSETRPAEPAPLKRKPQPYKPETVVITYPDPKTRRASSDRDPFVKPRSGPGMTRPRIVANPKP